MWGAAIGRASNTLGGGVQEFKELLTLLAKEARRTTCSSTSATSRCCSSFSVVADFNSCCVNCDSSGAPPISLVDMPFASMSSFSLA